jgi:glycerol-3-phosphate dehydrogenase
MLKRGEALDRLNEPWDLLVVGGGVTGAGVLLEASRRGLRAVLVERNDFASGTSSRSSKLVHGGLRYLTHGQIALTREAVLEREALLREAPGLVMPMPFLFPHYRGKKPGRVPTEIALTLYDVLAGRRTHRFLHAEAAIAVEPTIERRSLTGAHLYYDATTDDAGLVIALLEEAQLHGGVAVNYTEVLALERDARGFRQALVRDRESGLQLHVSAGCIVNATGVFADELRSTFGAAAKLRPLRGSHLTFEHARLPVRHAVAFPHPADGRPVFAYPWLGTTLVGTTDLDHDVDLRAEPSISSAEVQYLFDALDSQFPDVPIRRDEVIASFAGVRPIVRTGKSTPSGERRDHLLLVEDGLVTITGGKMTTFRPMALAALGAASRQLGKRLDLRRRPVFATPPHQSAEDPLVRLTYALQTGCVVHMDDLLLRRTRIGLQRRDGGAVYYDALRPLCAQHLGWNDARFDAERAGYERTLHEHYRLPQ